MQSSNQLRDAIVGEVILRLYEESLPRILKCLDQLDNNQIWWRPNETSNSIGNLVLHLSGNVSQWIYSGLGGYPDHRKRQVEFDERSVIDKDALRTILLQTMEKSMPVIQDVKTDDLL